MQRPQRAVRRGCTPPTQPDARSTSSLTTYVRACPTVPLRTMPAVDQQLGAVHVARGVGGEEDERLGDLLRRGDAAERDALLVVRAHLRRVRRPVERRVGRARRQRVDRDPVRAELDRERLRERPGRRPSPCSRPRAPRSAGCRDRGDVDDAARPRRHHLARPRRGSRRSSRAGWRPCRPCQSSSVVSRNGFTISRAALLTQMSIPPQRRDGLGGQLVDVAGVARVAAEHDHLAPRGLDGLDGRLCRLAPSRCR